jgi:general stress protein 26
MYNGGMVTEPRSTRFARFPPGYGEPASLGDPLPWSFVDERLRVARNYWLATVAPSGRPHVRPVDGVWVAGALCFGGSDKALWVRNLMANPNVSVHLPSDNDVVILEGTAEFVTDPEHPLAAASAAASREKYPQYFSDASSPEFQPFWMVRPSTGYAWTLEGFPRGAARLTFDQP